jgi:transcriptional regulator with XRE-family HTH domain
MTIRGLVLLILRTLADWTQGRLAAETGLRRREISDYERGTLPVETLQRLAVAMGYSIARVQWLILLVDEICDARPSDDLKHRIAGEVRRQVERVTLVVLTRIEEEGSRRYVLRVFETLRDRTASERRQLLEALPELGTSAVMELLAEEIGNAADESVGKRQSPRPATRPALPPSCLALLILRTLAGLTQEALATAAGLAHETISLLERKRASPPATLEQLATAMGFSPAQVQRVLSAAGEICDGIVVSDDLQHQTAAEIGRHAERVVLSVLTRIEDEDARWHARQVWCSLRNRTTPERRQLLEAFPEMCTWAVVEVLCAESERAAAHSAVAAGELSDLALSTAGKLPLCHRSQAQGYAWGHSGNSRRVAGNLPTADEAFVVSASLWQAGVAGGAPCPLDGSRLLDLEASLRREERRPLEALALLERAIRVPNQSPATRARLLIKTANTFEAMEESAQAIAALREAELSVQDSQGAHLFWLLRCGLIVSLCSLGRAAEANDLMPTARALTAQVGQGLAGLRLRWLESRVAAGLGRTGEAIELLSSVRADFVDLKIVYDATLATSELAVLYLKIGRTTEVKALIRQSVPIFCSEGIYPEAQKALATFSEAVEQETITLALAQRVVTYLQRAQHDAGVLPFEA